MIFDFSVKTYLTKRVVYDLIDLIGDLRSDPQIDSCKLFSLEPAILQYTEKERITGKINLRESTATTRPDLRGQL